MEKKKEAKKYRLLLISAGLGSVLGAGIIVGLSATITIWQNVLGLSAGQVGIVSSLLTFYIAAGSLLAGKISAQFGLIRAFNYMNLGFIVGTILIIFAQNLEMLMIGTTIAGFISGVDLPIALTVISQDAPDDKTAAELVSGTQIYWTVGILLATLAAFATSAMPGALSAQIVMGILAVIAAGTFLLRNGSKEIRELHEKALQKNRNQEQEAEVKKSVLKFLFGKEKKKYLGFFICIMMFYCGWNLLANTFGQFQTYMLVKANASQSFATGAGLVLTLVCMVVAAIFSKIAGGRNRNVAFGAGIIIMVAALIGLALS